MRYLSKQFVLFAVFGINAAFSSLSFAGDSLALSGFESAKNNSYYYLGYLKSFEGSTLGNGYVQRFWVDYLSYEYFNGSADVNANAPGLSYTLGYQSSKSDQSWGAYLGLQARKTYLTPDDAGNQSRGNRGSLVAAIDGKQHLNDFIAIELMANYAPNTGYWSRVRVPLGVQIKTGPEYSVQGNPNYQNQKIGWFINDIDVGAGFKTGLKAGYSRNEGLGGSIYLGLDITRYFP